MNITDAIGIRLSCKACGQAYEVPLRDILMSHDLLEHEGSPISQDAECPPIAQVLLADDKDIADLLSATVEFTPEFRSVAQPAA